jgi:hypothetical protein
MTARDAFVNVGAPIMTDLVRERDWANYTGQMSSFYVYGRFQRGDTDY